MGLSPAETPLLACARCEHAGADQQWTLASATTTGRRAHNEDRVLLLPTHPAALLADGMGGVPGGALASTIAVDTASGVLADTRMGGAQRARAAIARADDAVRAAGAAHGMPGAGSTLTLALVHGHRMIVGHVGDTRAYLWRGRRLSQITEDHTLAAERTRQRHPLAARTPTHILSRALGQNDVLVTDLYQRRWRAGDRYFLCSDGLYTVLAPDEIAECLGDDTPPHTRLAALVESAYRRGSSDNISAILMEHGGTLRGLGSNRGLQWRSFWLKPLIPRLPRW